MSEFSIADAVMSPTLPVFSAAAGNLGGAAASSTSPMATLGDYELHREIGRGGMGIVYEATQISLRRNVAIKTLPFAAVLDQQQVTRFRNEAQAAASLHHPHIVPVYAVGCERGVHYYSMQLIDGDTLERTMSAMHANAAGQQRAEKLSSLRRDEARQAAAEMTAELHGSDIHESKIYESNACEADACVPDAFAGQATSRAVKDQGSTVQSVHDRRTIRSIVQLFANVADALDYAHEQGVIHRDIKPSNLLIDGSGKVWVADFGLARCRGVGNLTADGSVLGTARYMSPEQIAGRPQAVDHRTDIYSLGITLYEMLTLQPAFADPTRAQLMRAVESDQPPSPRRLNPKIEIDLETIVLKAISKSKDERYATAGEFADDLRRYLDGLPTLARRPGKIDLAFRWAVRHRQMVLLSLFMLVSAVAGLSLTTVLVSNQTRIAEQQTKSAQRQLVSAFRFFDCFSGLAIDRPSSLPGGNAVLREFLMEAKPFAAEFGRYTEQNSSYGIAPAKLYFFIGEMEAKLGDPKLAEENYRLAIEHFVTLERTEGNNPTIATEHAECLHVLAHLRKQTGHYQDAKTLYEEATQLQELVIALDPEDEHAVIFWAKTQTNLAKLEWECGEQKSALSRMEETVSALVQCAADHSEHTDVRSTLIESRNTLVGLNLEKHPDSAEDLVRQNISTLNDWLQDPTANRDWDIAHPVEMASKFTSLPPICQLAVAQNNLAELLTKKQKFAEALDLTAAAIEICHQATVAPRHGPVMQRQLATALNNRGQILFARHAAGDADQAELAFEESERVFRAMITAEAGDPHLYSRLAGVLHNLSVVKQSHGELHSAVKDLTIAIEMQSTAVQKSPLNHGFRAYLKLHSELLEQLLHRIDPSTNSSEHACWRADSPGRSECRDCAPPGCLMELGSTPRNHVRLPRTLACRIGDHKEGRS